MRGEHLRDAHAKTCHILKIFSEKNVMKPFQFIVAYFAPASDFDRENPIYVILIKTKISRFDGLCETAS